MTRKRNILGTLASNALNLGIGLATSSLLARTLGPRGRGEYAAILIWPAIIGSWSILGLNQSVVYFTAREPRGVRRFVSTALVGAGLVLLVVIPASWFILPIVLAAQSREVVEATQTMAVIYLPAVTGFTIGVGALQGLGLFAQFNALRVGQSALWLAAVGVLFVAQVSQARVFGWANAAALAATLPVALALIMRAGPPPTSPNLAVLRRLTSYSLPTWLGAIPLQLNRRVDQLVMAGMVEPRLLGYYAAAAGISSVNYTAVSAIANVAMPDIASSRGSHERGLRVGQYSRLSVVVGIVSIVCLGSIMPWLITLLFGASFRPAVAPALVLLAATAVDGVTRVLEDSLLGLGRPLSVLRAEGIGLVFTVTGLFLTVRPYPLLGPATISLAAYALVGILVAWDCSAETGMSMRDLLVPRVSEIRSTARQILSRR